MSNDGVTRVSIHRSAIQQQYCSCWGVPSMGVNGTTRFLIADGVNIDTLEEFLDVTGVRSPVYLSEPVSVCWDKLVSIAKRGLPIILRTGEILENRVLSLLSNLPHSSIQVSIDFLRENPFNSLEEHFSRFQGFRTMMALAKAWKISVGICLGYQPVIVNRFDMYDIIQSVRPVVSNMTIHFPQVTSEYMLGSEWNTLYNQYAELINQAYTEDSETRCLGITEVFKREVLKELDFFLKSRKIILDEIDMSLSGGNRIRHTPLSPDSNPFGVRMIPSMEGDHTPDGILVPEAHICRKCNKPVI